MNVSIIANQMMVLFLMMVAGYGAYKRGMVSREGTKSLSSLIVNILNPCLILSGVMNKEVTYGPRLILENLLLVFLMFALLIALSLLFVRLARPGKDRENTYRLMVIFPNLGFMGIPLITSVYGQASVNFVAFYIVGYNLLIYSYGILLSTGKGGRTERFPLRRLINPGMGASVLAILIFALRLRLPDAVGSFFGYMGNAAVALSMMTVGMTVAQADLKSIFMDRCQLGFTAFSLLLVPLVCIPFLHLLPIDPMSYGIFILLIAMPVGSTVTLIEMEYGGGDGRVSAGGIALTSLVSMVTIPLISFIA